jgi:RNA polymerase sigma-70 factor (ECF subfamily)
MTPHDLVLFLRWRYATRFADASDAQLLDRYLAARDEPALCALVARHAGPLFNLCRVELGDLGLAEDAFQETVLRLHCRGRSIRDRGAVRAWLLTTTRRLCAALRDRRDRQTATEYQAATRRCEAAAEPADLLSREEQRRRVARAVGRLPDRYGVPLHLGLQGLSPEQIGEALKLPVPTVKTRITRGRKLLLGKLRAEGLGAVAGACLVARRAEAVPAGLVAATVRAAVVGKQPAVGPAAAWWLWPGAAAGVVAAAVGAGLAMRSAAAPAPVPQLLAAVRETEKDRDLRLLRAAVARQVIEALRPLMVFGGGEIRLVQHEARDTRLFLELEADHRFGFRSRMHLYFETLNGGLAIFLDQFAKGQWKQIGWESPIILSLPGVAGERPVGRELYDRVYAAYAVLPVRRPPLLPQTVSEAAGGVARPFLGAWRYLGDRRYPADLIYLTGSGRVAYLDRYGRRAELAADVQPGGAPALRHPAGWLVTRAGARLSQVGGANWWERDDRFGSP